MLYSATILAWGIAFSRLALADTLTQSADHTRRSLEGNSSSGSYSTFLSSATGVISASIPTASASSSYSTFVRNDNSATSAPAPITLAPTPGPACDATRPKFAINNLLVTTNQQLRGVSDCIVELSNQVNEENVQQTANMIADDLQKSVTAVKGCLSSIQKCGIDPTPLSPNKGTTLSDVSWSALQTVLTLKSTFESVSSLYKPFPLIKKTCSGILVNLSTALSSLIGACSEQLNLFDTLFFPLVTPQLKDFEEIDDSFASFFGSFISS